MIRSISHQTATVVSMWTGPQTVDQIGDDGPAVPEEEEGEDGRERDDEGDQPEVGEEVGGVAHPLLDQREEPALVPRLLREKPLRLRVVLGDLHLEPVDAHLERPGERGEVRDQRRALRAEARRHDGGEEDHEQAEAREERGHGHRPADPEALDPRGEGIEEVREEGGQRDRDHEAPEQEPEADDGGQDGEPPERRGGPRGVAGAAAATGTAGAGATGGGAASAVTVVSLTGLPAERAVGGGRRGGGRLDLGARHVGGAHVPGQEAQEVLRHHQRDHAVPGHEILEMAPVEDQQAGRRRREGGGRAREVVDQGKLAERGAGAEGHDPLRALAGVANDLDLAVQDDEQALPRIALREHRLGGRVGLLEQLHREAREQAARQPREDGGAPEDGDAASMLRVSSPVEPARQALQHGAHYSNPGAVLSWNSCGWWPRRHHAPCGVEE